MKTVDKNLQRLLDDSQIYGLAVILFLSALPHFFNFPLVVSLFFSSVLLFRIVFISVLKKPLKRWALFVFLLFALVSVLLPGSKLGTGFGVSLLMVMLAMKTLESKSYRDAYVLLFLCYFLLVTVFLYNQQLWIWFYVFALALAILHFLHTLNFSSSVSDRRRTLLFIGKVTLQALPLTLIFFVVFPRLSGPLWAFKQTTGSAVTGIGNSISPGTVSNLSKSNQIAFRVKFDDPEQLPSPALRYWRGPVMTDTNGYDWYADTSEKPLGIPRASSSPVVSYQLTLEPTGKKWLFALDLPVNNLPAKTLMNASYSVVNAEIISNRQSFVFSSDTSLLPSTTADEFFESALYVPDVVTERLQKQLDQFVSQSSNQQELIDNILKFFNRENFIYTLSPPRLLNNPVDEFLFDSRKGFCEHYATSFVILMRMADIPARIVAGYQGGEWNPTGEHLIVRQSDAHAWAEVWFEDSGWVRVDPTAAIAPERIEQSIDPLETGDGSQVIFRVDADNPFTGFLREASWMLDAIDLNWHRWVVGFSDKTQKRLFSFAQLGRYSQYLVIALGVIFCLLFVIAVIYFSKRVRRKISDPAQIIWLRFYDKLEKQQVAVKKTDGPLTIMNKAFKAFPEKAGLIRIIAESYIKLRYAGSKNPDLLNNFRKFVSQF
jgi:transglutaminase-like putative cysteine protease